MRLYSCLLALLLGVSCLCGCTKKQGSVEGHVDNQGLISQSGITVQISENGEIITDADTDFDGYYTVSQTEPGSYEVYIRDGDPGPGTFDTLKSSARVRWRRSPSVSFNVEGGLIASPDDLIRYTLHQAKLSSWDSLAGFAFAKAVGGMDPFVSQEGNADIFVKQSGDSGVAFGTSGYESIIYVGDDSLEVGSTVPGSGYQERYTFQNTVDCVDSNYVIRCRNGRYAKIHIFGAGLENPTDTIPFPYITFLSFYQMDTTAGFPPIPSN